MTINFRCLNIDEPFQPRNSENLANLLKRETKGISGFYVHSSWISSLYRGNGTTPGELKKCFEQLSTTPKVKTPLSQLDSWDPAANTLSLVSEVFMKDFPAKVLTLSGKLRKTTEQSGHVFSSQPGFLLNQASTVMVITDRVESSYGIRDYHEYLLWNDGGLWEKAEWDACSDQEARNRLAWTGAGWMSSRLERQLVGQTKPWFYEPNIEAWAKAAMDNLLQFDNALIDFYKKDDKNAEPFNRKTWNTYIDALCGFLPYHYSRDDSKELLPTVDPWGGGPRKWQGFLHDSMTMHIRHLLLDGWLTLWPVSGEEGQSEQLYLQPGSIALLYWAARQANLPHTQSTAAFLTGYDWSDEHWFGGQWKTQRSES